MVATTQQLVGKGLLLPLASHASFQSTLSHNPVLFIFADAVLRNLGLR